MPRFSDTEKMILSQRIQDAHMARISQFDGAYEGDSFAMVVGVKACGDEPGSLLDAPDSIALRKAIESLGYPGESMAVIDSGMFAGDAAGFRVLVELIDPMSIVLFDSSSKVLFEEAFRIAMRESVEMSAGAKSVMGRTVVCIDGFERALEDPDAKRVAWSRLKALAR